MKRNHSKPRKFQTSCCVAFLCLAATMLTCIMNRYVWQQLEQYNKEGTSDAGGKATITGQEADAEPVPVLSKCDRLPLLFGQNTWDEERDEFVLLPPIPETTTEILHMNGTQKYSESTICGPRILIVGAMKCGTNSLGRLLSYHPRVKFNRCRRRRPKCDPSHFVAAFGAMWEDGGLLTFYHGDPINYVGKYAQRLPITDEYTYITLPNGSSLVGPGSLTFDKYPDYMHSGLYPTLVERVKQLLPNVKVIFTLCNPVERLYSEYNHLIGDDQGFYDNSWRRWNLSRPHNFTEYVSYLRSFNHLCHFQPTLCNEEQRRSLQTGVYDEHVLAWRNAFGTNNILVFEMTDSDHDKMKKVMKLMGDYLPEHEYPWDMLPSQNTSTISFDNPTYHGRTSGYENHTKAFEWLHEYYYQHNVALAKEIDAEWPLLWNQQ